jgi:hypothetical protein
MSTVASLTHGDLFDAAVVAAAAVTGLAAYLALLPTKKAYPSWYLRNLAPCNLHGANERRSG